MIGISLHQMQRWDRRLREAYRLRHSLLRCLCGRRKNADGQQRTDQGGCASNEQNGSARHPLEHLAV
jgi:hypothetical protein